MNALRAGIIGAGFIGGVHAYAVRASGGIVAQVADASPDASAAAAVRFGAIRGAESAESLITSGDVDVVHICTPNDTHYELALAALEAGKAVICEKPLATSVEQASHLARVAAHTGAVTAVPFVYRFYPSVREARYHITTGEAGDLWMLHGSYLQDWLSSAQETNWRVDPARGGGSRAFGDIGVHWCDLMEFTTGHRITRLVARMSVAHKNRRSPDGRTLVGTEDGATVLFETDRGATGSVVVSQVSPGRKNRLWFSFDGTNAAYVFDQEVPDSLWVGGRPSNTVVPRGPDTFSPGGGADYARLPSGHPQGYQDSFTAFVADAYAAVAGARPDGLPSFDDGLRAAVITEAVLASAAKDEWVEVPS
ncbi:Gfo/Idh/MocA family protein [Pedococcus sp. NPDC057267]|uniref:Gfo/Idh/MocA family protein n=1 Tax=Pedococcus sp. NPDC057267 TaxID=3346077 RepID=UPI0036347B27